MEERIYLELNLQKSITTDSNGNWIIEAEASNENLDFQEQIVLQDALTKSSNYFLENGVISYDHRHLREEDNPEKYIIGEPLKVYTKGKRTFVKMLLYKSNTLAQEIIKKLKDGSTRIKTSVGGKLPQVVKEYNKKLGKIVEKVKSVLWDELAITFKPVNQTLSPITLGSSAFVKALEAGYGTDVANLSGGGSLRKQDLQGNRDGDRKRVIQALILKMAFGDINNKAEAADFIEEYGFGDESDLLLGGIVEKKQSIMKGVSFMEKDLMKTLDDAVDELEKSMKAKPSYPDEPKGATGEDVVEPEVEDEDEGDEEEMKKSLSQEVEEDAGDFLDASEFLNTLTKSISRKIEGMETQIETLSTMLEKSLQAQAAMAKSMASTSALLKSIGESPEPRKSVLSKGQRFGDPKGDVQMSRAEILQKANKALDEKKMTMEQVAKIEGRLNKGVALEESDLSLLKSM